jgi:site-specific DNA-methyltransferase (adenine-specific)
MGYNGRARHEGILFMSKGRRRKPCDLSVPDVLSFKSIDARLRRHGCEKPQGLLEQLIRFATRAGELVLDIFAGSCSTGRAALRLGRDSLMIEKDPRALEAAVSGP